MSSTVIAALARHILTALAGGFAVQYSIDGATFDAVIGGLAALVGVAWSIYEKRNPKQLSNEGA